MRAPKAEFNLAVPGAGDKGLDNMGVTGMIREVMTKSNNWDEAVRVMARLFKGLICADRDKVHNAVAVKYIKAEKTLQFAVPTEPSVQGCTKSGILVTGLPAKHRFGSQFMTGPMAQPAKTNSQPA